MSLAGNLRTMPLPDILQWIATGRKTGTLHIERRSILKRIAFRDGRIYTSWSNDPRESLGQFLIRDRRITEEQLFKSLLRQEAQGRLLGAILVNEGLLTEGDLRKTLASKAEESIYDIFLWSEGKFEFREGDVPEEVPIALDIQVTEILFEGVKRVDDWDRIRKVFPSMKTTFKLKGAPHEVDDPVERQVLGLVASGKTIAEMSLDLRRSEFETALSLYDLNARDLIAIGAAVTDEQKVTDPVATIKELLTAAYQRLQERRYDSALEAYEQVLSLDRLNQHAKKGLIAVAEARSRERVLRTVPRNKVPVLKMDLASLTRESFEPQEGFVLSRVNGQWDVQSILKLCPLPEDDVLLIFARLLERKVIELR